MLAISQIKAIHEHRTPKDDDTTSITYITEEARSVLKALLPF